MQEAEERGEEGYHIDPETHEKLSEAGKRGGSAGSAARKKVSSNLAEFFLNLVKRFNNLFRMRKKEVNRAIISIRKRTKNYHLLAKKEHPQGGLTRNR